MLVSMFLMTGCGNEDTQENLKQKAVEEVEFFSSKIINIANNLNGISYENYAVQSEKVEKTQEATQSQSTTGGEEGESSSASGGQGTQNGGQQEGKENNSITTTEMVANGILTNNNTEIDWKLIKSEIELINEAWTVVIVDLHSLNIPSQEILNFSDTLNKCILSIDKENKEETLANLAELYTYIPKYVEVITGKESTKNVKLTQSYIIKAYSLVEKKDWKGVEENIAKAESTFSNVLKDTEFTKNRTYKTNKTYVSINEMKNSIANDKNEKLFYIKYKNVMENISTL